MSWGQRYVGATTGQYITILIGLLSTSSVLMGITVSAVASISVVKPEVVAGVYSPFTGWPAIGLIVATGCWLINIIGGLKTVDKLRRLKDAGDWLPVSLILMAVQTTVLVVWIGFSVVFAFDPPF